MAHIITIVIKMIVKSLSDCEEFIAGDKSILKEIIHPSKEHFDIHYSLAWARVEPREKTLPHKLRSAEVYYITEGTGLIHINNEEKPVRPGDTIYIPPDAVQFIENKGEENLEFLCIVDPAWQPEAEIIISDGQSEY